MTTARTDQSAVPGARLVRAAHRVFDGDSALASDPALRRYLGDLAGRRGLPVRAEVFAAGAGGCYAEMTRPLVAAVADGPVDLLVLAFGVHDVQPGRNVAPHLAEHCPGRPLAFAVCDQGPTAAFTALRLVGDHLATGAGTRAVLLVAEQSAVHYPLPTPAPVPDRHAAVALLFESGPDAAPVVVRQHPGLPAGAVDDVLATDVAELTGTRTDAALFVGGDPAQPYTGLWSRLCCGPSTHTDHRLALLAEHDPTLGYLSVAAVDRRPGPLCSRPGDLQPDRYVQDERRCAPMAVKD